MRDNFERNRAAFEALAEKVLASDYVHVSKTGMYGIPYLDDSTDVFGYKENDPNGEISIGEFIEDDPEWDKLLQEARVFGVEHQDGAVSFVLVAPLLAHEKHVFARYVHSVDRRKPLIECLPAHAKIRCGVCAYDLVDDWYIHYRWSPEEVLAGEKDNELNDQVTDEDHSAALSDCYAEGYEAMGYELEQTSE